MDIVLQGLGWIGAAGLLSAYFLISTKRLSPDNTKYQLLNLVSAIMLAINAYHIGSIPFIIINVFWAIVAAMSLMKSNKTP